MLKTLDVLTTSISELKKTPRSFFKETADQGTEDMSLINILVMSRFVVKKKLMLHGWVRWRWWLEVKTKFKIEYFPEAKEEYDSLEGNELTFVDKGLNRIRDLGMQASQPLHGNLVGCRNLKNRKMSLRIIFAQDKNY